MPKGGNIGEWVENEEPDSDATRRILSCKLRKVQIRDGKGTKTRKENTATKSVRKKGRGVMTTTTT